ncbi:LruC domain-containing protein [Bacteroides sp. 51]|uniref:LruC domain-containing protein n=1 Tax=Bacteroides sp. 51 TaxID=2302938 RepID=UPI0013D4AC96|nr:LruC domain-containing protein [Bacteroides sp. 51]
MRKRSGNFFAISCLLATIFFLTGCQDKDYYEPKVPGETVNSNPSLAEFSTTRTVTLDFSYQVPDGCGAAFDLYAENPYTFPENGQPVLQSGAEPIGSGIFVGGANRLTKMLPSYVEELYAYSASPLVPNLLYAKIVDGVASFERVEATAQRTTSRAAGDFWNRDASLFLGQYGNRLDVDAKHRPNYIAYANAIPQSTLTRIANTFPEKVRAGEEYYTDASMYLQQDAKVWVGIIGNGAWWDNTLSYFCYKGKKEDLQAMDRMDVTEVVAIPSLVLRDGGLQIGDYVQLKYYNAETGMLEEEFPKGTTIGWMLRSQSYNSANQTLVQYPYGIFYSVIGWNVENDKTLRNHTMAFNAGTQQNPFICFGFEDEYNDNGKGDRDCNDIIFHVATDPHDAINPPPVIDPVDDIITYDNSLGVVAFEDYWPRKGDYDLNDVVVKYTSSVKLVKTANEAVAYATEIQDCFGLIHTGADYKNSFSYKIPFAMSDIESIEVDDVESSYTDDGDGVIIDLCKDVTAAIKPYQDPVTPKVYNITVKLRNNRISQEVYNQNPAPYNPFISPAAGVEVHLPFYKPTSRANILLFGTEDDRSNPSKGLYYVSGENINYPFAIHLSGIGGFVIPTETKSIDVTYPDYTKWVESGFERYLDWYSHPNK